MQLPELIKALAVAYPVNPNQKNIRYTDAYGVVDVELKKLTSLYGEKPDYARLIQASLELLKNGCTHLYILTALGFALPQVYQWQGFQESVKLMTERLQQWDTLYPSADRLRGRVAPIQWLIERWRRFLDTHPLQGLGLDFISKTVQSLTALDAILTERFADQLNLSPILTPFIEQEKRQQQELAQAQKAAELKAQEEALKREQTPKAAVELMENLEANSEAISPEAFLDNLNTQELFTTASKRLLAEQLELLKNSPFEFSIYKHNRAILWWSTPMSENELLNKIDEQGLNWQAYSDALLLKAKQNHQDALIAFESLFHQHPFFLDLQLQICDCLQALKAENRLLNLLKSEVKQLYQEHPGLLEARINNEIVAVDKHTQLYFDLRVEKEDKPAEKPNADSVNP